MPRINMKHIKKLLTHFSRLLFSVRVHGESAWPALYSGGCYLASSLVRPNMGSFIVFKNPRNSTETFVKQVKSVHDMGYEVGGLVSWSSSSKDFGIVPKELVLGTI